MKFRRRHFIWESLREKKKTKFSFSITNQIGYSGINENLKLRCLNHKQDHVQPIPACPINRENELFPSKLIQENEKENKDEHRQRGRLWNLVLEKDVLGSVLHLGLVTLFNVILKKEPITTTIKRKGKTQQKEEEERKPMDSQARI